MIDTYQIKNMFSKIKQLVNNSWGILILYFKMKTMKIEINKMQLKIKNISKKFNLIRLYIINRKKILKIKYNT
jgi:hypothetical protein